MYTLVDRELSNFTNDVKINALSEREAMGLPSHYLASKLDAIQDRYFALRSLSSSELVATIEDENTEFFIRFAASQILALVGDPRISVFSPHMMEISSWKGILGLSNNQVDEVLFEYSGLGIERSWIEKECPEYEVNIQSFKLAKYPVTNFEFLKFLVDTRYEEIPSSWHHYNYPLHFSNHPVYSISADACEAYAKWLSEKTGRRFRLPSESEWEYAAGGHMRLEFPWGNQFLKDHANTIESGIFSTTAVGLFPKGRSPFGCEDMAGNVEEFVSTKYHPYSDSSIIVDDLVALNGNYNVARGGSFVRFRDLARTRRRHGPNPKSIYAMGFRLAESI